MSAEDPRQLARSLATGVSRRNRLRFGGAGLAATALVAASFQRVSADAAAIPPIEPKAGKAKPWLLTSGDQFRPTGPQAGAAADKELADLRACYVLRGAMSNVARAPTP
jgi:hypothetical protein